jgi:hypothetical protein
LIYRESPMSNFAKHAASAMAISDGPIFFSGRQGSHRIVTSFLLLFWTMLSLTVVLLEIPRLPWAVLPGLFMGVLVRCLGQQLKVKEVICSPKAAQLAVFDFDGQAVRCRFDDSLIAAYTDGWGWRIAAAVAAGLACLAAQYLPGLRSTPLSFDLFGLPENHPVLWRWLRLAIEGCAFGLPLCMSALFLRISGPKKRWTNQVKAAIERRAAASMEQIVADREIDGLEAAIAALWRELGVDRSGDYRAAIGRRLRSRTAEVVLQPATGIAMLQAATELARQDLRNLISAVESVHRIRFEIDVLLKLASAFRNPLHEMKAEELNREMKPLVLLAANRQWGDLQSHAAWLGGELDDLRTRIHRHSTSVPTVMLPSGSDPYRILGVTMDTPTQMIRKLRSRLALLYHPDVGESIGNSAKMAELNAAYDAVMRDRDKEGR